MVSKSRKIKKTNNWVSDRSKPMKRQSKKKKKKVKVNVKQWK